MNETPTPAKNPTIKPEKAPKRPGTRLMTAGFIVAAFGVIVSLIAAGSRHVDIYDGTVQGGVNALDILIIVAGLVLAAAGFGRRVLAALENKGPSNN